MDNSQKENVQDREFLSNETGKQEDHVRELDLLDYLKVILKHKIAILLCSLIPAIGVGLYLSFLPMYYQRTFSYETQGQLSDATEDLNSDIYGWNLNRKRFAILLESFYETTNINQIINALSKEKFEFFANCLKDAKSKNNLAQIIKFETIPKFIKLSKVPRKNPIHLKEAMSLQAAILKMTITGKSKTDILAISSLIRENFENIIITNNVKKILEQSNVDIYGEFDRIDARKLVLGFKTQREGFLLESFKNLKSSEVADKELFPLILHDRTEYMPVSSQIHASEIKLINYQAEILIIDKQRESIRELLVLNEILLAKLDEPVSVNSKEQAFLSHIYSLLKANKKTEEAVYLRGLAEKIEGMAAMVKPVTTEPYTYIVDKGVYKKSAIVFAVMFITTLIAAFLVEGFKRDKTVS